MKKSIAFSGAAAAFFFAAGAAAQTYLIDNAQIQTAGPAGVIERGDVLVRDGLIVAVGPELSPSAGVTVINGAGKVLTPGVIAPYSDIGLKELGLDAEANDASPSAPTPFSAALDARDAYNPDSTLIAVNRAGGVTRALSAPSPAFDKLFAGQAALIDLSGERGSVTRGRVAQIAAMGYGGAARVGDTRMASWAQLRLYLDEARSYAQNPRDYVQRQRPDGVAIADLRALGAVIEGEQALMVSLDRASEIRQLINLKNQYALNVILLGGSEAWREADALAAAEIPVILDGFENLPTQFEDIGATLENAARLSAAGVEIAFFNVPTEAHNLRALPQMAGNAVANGLPYEEAIKALTLYPARMLGVDDRLGSIEIGKYADLVLWDGDPLEVTTRPEAVLINGKQVSLETRQTMLRDRYRDLSKGALPHAYRGDEQ